MHPDRSSGEGGNPILSILEKKSSTDPRAGRHAEEQPWRGREPCIAGWPGVYRRRKISADRGRLPAVEGRREGRASEMGKRGEAEEAVDEM